MQQDVVVGRNLRAYRQIAQGSRPKDLTNLINAVALIVSNFFNARLCCYGTSGTPNQPSHYWESKSTRTVSSCVPKKRTAAEFMRLLGT
jgi:hypothetical protein